jgi:hypothetical protein
MQLARRPEAPERKQGQQSQPPELLSKMTNRKQDAGVRYREVDRFWQRLLMY